MKINKNRLFLNLYLLLALIVLVFIIIKFTMVFVIVVATLLILFIIAMIIADDGGVVKCDEPKFPKPPRPGEKKKEK